MKLLLAAGLGWAVTKAVFAAIWSALTAPLRGPRGATTISRHAGLTAARTLFGTATVDQILYVLPPDSPHKNFIARAKRKGTLPKTVELPDGTTAFWLGNPNAERLIVYYPGGAYCFPALNGHIEYVNSLTMGLQDAGIDIGVLFLIYDLATQAPYPRQLEQAMAILRYAIETLGKHPSKIVLHGDSAGGHLILSALSHLAHPHPQIPMLSLSESLAGAVLLSPWMIDSCTDYKSYERNKYRDSISLKDLVSWAPFFLGDAEPDSYNQPAVAPEGWWRDLPAKKIFITAGEHEILLDSTLETANKIQGEHPNAVMNVALGEYHAQAITSFELGIKPGEQYKTIMTWLKEVLV
ncbi:esterase [Aspergillus heteromorphus CBS 117.55]|uniref:Esterase n=1 Tax=Aspergillus heteromorphus CBS 117.55 TaxID=1448321 RepID=A0A317VAV2_9EURO|nr:esterase [Aspergillus heteromorphus CBS 117.55]PWY70509.1 esterase [Aspergillus heteromorphus CBS 117.55]